jgi:hypothetical protein
MRRGADPYIASTVGSGGSTQRHDFRDAQTDQRQTEGAGPKVTSRAQASSTQNRSHERRPTARRSFALTTFVQDPIEVSTAFAYLPSHGDHKTADIHIEGAKFGGTPFMVRLTLEAEDGPTSAV